MLNRVFMHPVQDGSLSGRSWDHFGPRGMVFVIFAEFNFQIATSCRPRTPPGRWDPGMGPRDGDPRAPQIKSFFRKFRFLDFLGFFEVLGVEKIIFRVGGTWGYPGEPVKNIFEPGKK